MAEREYKSLYFVGIGGIGMSAIARYFLAQGLSVGGYDRVESPLTKKLESEGAEIVYSDGVELVGSKFRDPSQTLVIYTPAVPSSHAQLSWFREQGFVVEKRSQMLGHITKGRYVMAVAGTHGKTTVTTLTAWLNHVSAQGGNDPQTGREGKGGDGGGSAFLGGIAVNFNSNLLLGEGERIAVEADEFDRSFLRLYPDVAVVTSVDPDHLDTFGSHEAVQDAFSQFIRQIKPGGALIIKEGEEIEIDNDQIEVYRYSFDEPCDFYTQNVKLLEGGAFYSFDIVCPDRVIENCRLGIPGWVNIENAVAATALLWVAGFDEQKLREGLAEFKGNKRRFEFYINTPKLVYMDDYAHHPRELEASITSVKKMFPGRKMTAVFQPHLYSRTKDFYVEFAQSLSHADEVILIPVYPARELPMEGVESDMIAELVTAPCKLVQKEELVEELKGRKLDVVVTFGAGDIDRCCEPIAEMLKKKYFGK